MRSTPELYTEDEIAASPARAEWTARMEHGSSSSLAATARIGLCLVLGIILTFQAGYAWRALAPTSGWLAFAGSCIWIFGSITAGFALGKWWSSDDLSVMRPPRSILWLRKYQKDHDVAFPLRKVFQNSNRAIATPLTIRDSQIRSSKHSGVPAAQASKFLRYIILCPLLLLPILFMTVGDITINGKRISATRALTTGDGLVELLFYWGFMLTVFLILLGLWILIRHFERKAGYVQLPKNPGQAELELDEFFRNVELSSYSQQRLHIFDAPDEAWQRYVLKAIEESDLILLDIAALTEKVEWQISAAFGKRRAECIIIAMPYFEGSNDADPSLKRKLIDMIGEDTFRRAGFLLYPERISIFDTQLMRLSNRLKNAMLDAIDATRSANHVPRKTDWTDANGNKIPSPWVRQTQ